MHRREPITDLPLQLHKPEEGLECLVRKTWSFFALVEHNEQWFAAQLFGRQEIVELNYSARTRGRTRCIGQKNDAMASLEVARPNGLHGSTDLAQRKEPIRMPQVGNVNTHRGLCLHFKWCRRCLA
eukprot:CAMPEP_0183339820 /NCGR_PEP_ID=MMETSP0164_2-20130417/6609_1 /TAXON_ID=221442 /ORGANISM="Coccolithus pelagicus ssp braarudi, Strain PLY182g" /LENGTH=125 /DNA_ID=CAMNT_0025509883 /DNA_START=159 /DNA_END=536 /DNA_ORIENTATION=+